MLCRSIVQALFAVLITASPAVAWEVQQKWTDPLSGRDYLVATETNAEGYSVRIFRDTDSKVRAVYSIPASSFDRVLKDGRVLAIRPGQNAVEEIEAAMVKDPIIEKAQSNGVDVRDLLWHGEGASPTNGTLRKILDSTTLYARFYTDTGTHLDTQWSLTGSPEAIALVLGIEIAVDPELQTWDKLQTELSISAVNQCDNDPGCVEKVLSCLDIISNGRDVEAFKACVKDATQ